MYSGMESAFSGFKFDPQLSLVEKRQLVHEIALWSEDAHMVLSSLTRRELLELICAEMGQERKYSGYSKNQMIEHLLKLISKNYEKTDTSTLKSTENGCKRQRTQEQLCHTSVQSDYAPQENMEAEIKILLACRAAMGQGDKFCKRCSCCICHKYENEVGALEEAAKKMDRHIVYRLSCDNEVQSYALMQWKSLIQCHRTNDFIILIKKGHQAAAIEGTRGQRGCRLCSKVVQGLDLIRSSCQPVDPNPLDPLLDIQAYTIELEVLLNHLKDENVLSSGIDWQS